jgi:hypothetical protein
VRIDLRQDLQIPQRHPRALRDLREIPRLHRLREGDDFCDLDIEGLLRANPLRANLHRSAIDHHEVGQALPKVVHLVSAHPRLDPIDGFQRLLPNQALLLHIEGASEPPSLSVLSQVLVPLPALLHSLEALLGELGRIETLVL